MTTFWECTRGIRNGLMKKAVRGRPLSREDRLRNKKISRIRAQVERPFAIIKSKWGHARARYIGLFRNEVHVHLISPTICDESVPLPLYKVFIGVVRLCEDRTEKMLRITREKKIISQRLGLIALM